MDISVKSPLPLLSIMVISGMSRRVNPAGVALHLLIQLTDVAQHVLEGSIVDQDVDSAHGLKRSVNHLLAVLLLPQVYGQTMTLTPSFFDSPFGLLRICFLLGQVDNQARRALHAKKNCGGSPDAGVAACDNGSLAFQFSSGLIQLVSVIFGWYVNRDGLGVLHISLQAWLCQVLNRNLMAYT